VFSELRDVHVQEKKIVGVVFAGLSLIFSSASLRTARRPESPGIDFECMIAVSWKLVAAAVNGTLAGVVVLLFATEFCILNCLFICPPLARG
jgi:hypothetical protein